MDKIKFLFIMMMLVPVMAMAQFTGGNGRGDYSLGYSPCTSAIEVANNSDAGAGSLRQAIADLCNNGTITFNASLDAATITLTSGELLIDKGLTIDASALSNGITINGNNVSRIFNINCGAASDITMKNFILINGNSTGNGAGIYMATGNIGLTLVDVDVNNCNGDNGGAIYQAGGSLDISGTAFESNTSKNGGAIYSTNNSSCSLVNCIIKANQSTESGGGGFLIHDNCTLTLTNCLLHDNFSPTWGGGIIILPNSTATLTNCTLSQNASGLGGGLYNAGGTFVINNSILWGNTSTQWGNQIETTAGISTTLNYSCFANVYGPTTWDVEGPVTNNASITSNPAFVNPDTDDFRIRGNSPGVNSGNNSYNTETNDIRGQARIQNTTIDMGAYEWTSGTDPDNVNVFVNLDASGNNDGTSWPDAFTSFQSALDIDLISGDKIWVAKGTYYPSSNYGLDAGNERFKHFRMIEGISVFGSLEGVEDVETYDLALRDFETYKTVLSGNIGNPGDSTDNCYHIFYHPDGLGLTSSALLDGFEIREAVANFESDFKDGAGMFNTNNSPEIRNCAFVKNAASDRGGAMYNSNSNPAVSRVHFSQNRALIDGGGVFNNDGSDPVFTSCGFSQNSAFYSGGGIYSKENSNPTLTNCLLVYNTAMYGGASFNQSPVTFINCTFSKNYAYQGGGLCNESDATIKNCIIWGNDGVVGKQMFIKESTATDINYSDYSNETDDVTKPGTLTGSSNIYVNPALVDMQTGDFRLGGNSPCADAGNNSYCSELYDIRGIGFDRNLNKTTGATGGTIDMGAYEFKTGTDPEFGCTNPTSGGVIAQNQQGCIGFDPDELTGTAPSGEHGTLEYKWQSSTTSDLTGFTDIASATAAAYDPGTLTDTTWFRRLARVSCMTDWTGCDTSNVVKITIEPAPVSGTLAKTPDAANVCQGDNVSAALSAGSGGNGSDSLSYRTKTGVNWTNWTSYISGNDISTEGVDSVEIQTLRQADYCDDAEGDTVSWSTHQMPAVSAGTDASIVEGEPYTLSYASAENYAGLTWTTSGDGDFDVETDLTPTYTPGDNDIAAGEVELCLTATPESPCTLDSTDCMTLTIWRYPTVAITSPEEKDVLYANPVAINGTATDADNNLSLIEVKLNGGSWQPATGTTNWTINFDLEPGKNTIEARAKDATDLYSDTASVTVTLSIQVINIPQGWSYVSSYLEPTDPNIVNMWADIVGANHLMILTGVTGIYAPAPFYINTLHNWDVLKGYKVKMNVADDLIVSGDSLTDKTVTFSAGVHLIPVLTNQTTPLDEVFDNPATDILYMLDIYSNLIYWPGGILYTLTELVPGKGYLANFRNPVTLSYPPLSNFTITDAQALPPAPGPWACTRTSNVHLISISAQAVNDIPNTGYIGAFDSQGKCVGYAAIEKTGTNLLLTVYGDEPMTDENDGIPEGEMIYFRAYNSQENAEKELTAAFNPNFPNVEGLFYINGLSGILGFKESATGVNENELNTQVQVYPNPATDELNIETKGFRSLQGIGTLITTEGKVVKSFEIKSNLTKLDVSDLQPGLYLLKIVSPESIIVKRVIVE